MPEQTSPSGVVPYNSLTLNIQSITTILALYSLQTNQATPIPVCPSLSPASIRRLDRLGMLSDWGVLNEYGLTMAKALVLQGQHTMEGMA